MGHTRHWMTLQPLRPNACVAQLIPLTPSRLLSISILPDAGPAVPALRTWIMGNSIAPRVRPDRSRQHIHPGRAIHKWLHAWLPNAHATSCLYYSRTGATNYRARRRISLTRRVDQERQADGREAGACTYVEERMVSDPHRPSVVNQRRDHGGEARACAHIKQGNAPVLIARRALTTGVRMEIAYPCPRMERGRYSTPAG